MQISFQNIKNWVYSNPRQAAQTLDQATRLFKGFVFAEVVGVCCFYPSLSKKTICVAGAISTVSALFLFYVRQWIAKVEEVNKFDDKGYTPLHHAVRAAPIEEITLLLQQGANVQAKVEDKDKTLEENWGNTPLHFAARYGRFDVVTLLLEKGSNVLEENIRGENSIHMAGDTGWREIFDLFIKKANIEEEDSPPFYNVFDLAKCGFLEALKLHMGKDVNIHTSDEDGFTLLHHAAGHGKLEIVQFFVSEGAEKEAKTIFNQTPYMLAYRNGWNEVMEFLKLQGVSPELGGTTFIWEDIAAWSSTVSTGKYFYGANPLGRDAQGRTALHYLSLSHSVAEILKLDPSLVNATDQNGDTPLHLVKSVPSLDILCEHGAIMDAENKLGQTPLNCALQQGNLEVVKALLGRKAKLNASATNQEGEPFLHCFIRRKKGDAGIELLKALFAEYDVKNAFRNSKKETCLHVAVDENDTKMTLFLLEQDPALINLKDYLGQTALHRAYRMAKLRNILLDKGADSSITDNKGLTPLTLYQQKEDEKKEKERRMREACHNSIYSSRTW